MDTLILRPIRVARIAIKSSLFALVATLALTLDSGADAPAYAAPVDVPSAAPSGRPAQHGTETAEAAPARPQITWLRQGAELIREVAASASRYFSASTEQSTLGTVGLHGPLDYFGTLGMQPAWDGKCAAKGSRCPCDPPEGY